MQQLARRLGQSIYRHSLNLMMHDDAEHLVFEWPVSLQLLHGLLNCSSPNVRIPCCFQLRLFFFHLFLVGLLFLFGTNAQDVNRDESHAQGLFEVVESEQEVHDAYGKLRKMPLSFIRIHRKLVNHLITSVVFRLHRESAKHSFLGEVFLALTDNCVQNVNEEINKPKYQHGNERLTLECPKPIKC